jgi:hypothetical protein
MHLLFDLANAAQNLEFREFAVLRNQIINGINVCLF